MIYTVVVAGLRKKIIHFKLKIKIFVTVLPDPSQDIISCAFNNLLVRLVKTCNRRSGGRRTEFRPDRHS